MGRCRPATSEQGWNNCWTRPERPRLSDWLADAPGNLSAQALNDLTDIIGYGMGVWGREVARRTASRLLGRCRAIAEGRAVGHVRGDIPTQRHVVFLVDAPWVIANRPDTRDVLRILHGARASPALFEADEPGA